ncbi:kinase-like protein [Sistotremastrum suecicum HHB10207 ss-3]|uniref:Kinase-like protein n=1 Tax=Sistotremastrum suecicum HHB10207 ss-3 TaxID=1314776 RepID=A0A165Y4U6_9AGAM|nr:kinase-like protein [Sistotremastrum suecicum HHB10207 ss-3]
MPVATPVHEQTRHKTIKERLAQLRRVVGFQSKSLLEIADGIGEFSHAPIKGIVKIIHGIIESLEKVEQYRESCIALNKTLEVFETVITMQQSEALIPEAKQVIDEIAADVCQWHPEEWSSTWGPVEVENFERLFKKHHNALQSLMEKFIARGTAALLEGQETLKKALEELKIAQRKTSLNVDVFDLDFQRLYLSSDTFREKVEAARLELNGGDAQGPKAYMQEWLKQRVWPEGHDYPLYVLRSKDLGLQGPNFHVLDWPLPDHPEDKVYRAQLAGAQLDPSGKPTLFAIKDLDLARETQGEVGFTSFLGVWKPRDNASHGKPRITGSTMKLIFEWCDGGDVTRYLPDQQTASKPVDLLQLVADVAYGIQYLHSAPRRVAHCDITPTSVLITAEGVAKLTSFYHSKAIREYNEVTNNSASVPLEDPLWSAPEAIGTSAYSDRSERKHCLASDIYGFALVALYILTGKEPYKKGDRRSMWDAVRNDEPATFEDSFTEEAKAALREHSHLTEDGIVELWGLLTDCWAKDRHQRPTINTVVERLNALPEVNLIRRETPSTDDEAIQAPTPDASSETNSYITETAA